MSGPTEIPELRETNRGSGAAQADVAPCIHVTENGPYLVTGVDDLICYGDGPVGHPFLYDRTDPAKLLLGSNEAGRPDDLPRNAQGIALIGDPRNDVHLLGRYHEAPRAQRYPVSTY